MQAPNNSADRLQRLAFYATPSHACSYLPEKQAITVFADPYAHLNNEIYSRLTLYGFRRSGKHIYRPSCGSCEACIPVRIPVSEFQPKRTQLRIWRKNQDITAVQKDAVFDPEHFQLYKKYMQSRHPDGAMNESDPEKYMEFLSSDWSITRFVEFRSNNQLVAISVIDFLDDGISAVYTFFDPSLEKRSLGTYAILWQVELTKSLQCDWLYLGYLIENCRKMSYKKNYAPLEQFRNGHWKRYG